jgi:hypothetical protein
MALASLAGLLWAPCVRALLLLVVLSVPSLGDERTGLGIVAARTRHGKAKQPTGEGGYWRIDGESICRQ